MFEPLVELLDARVVSEAQPSALTDARHAASAGDDEGNATCACCGTGTRTSVSHPPTMFFNGLTASPINKRPRLPSDRQQSGAGVSGSADSTASPCTTVFTTPEPRGESHSPSSCGRARSRSRILARRPRAAGWRDDVFIGLHGRRRARLGDAHPAADDAGDNIEPRG